MNVNEKIRTLRKEKNWSQAELAGKLAIHPNHLNRLEAGKYTPSLELLRKVTEVFQIDYETLLNDDVDPTQPLDLNNKPLADKLRMINEMDDNDQKTIISVIDAFLLKKQLLNVINSASLNVR